ncbi:hypothetical protein J6590_002385 [Homalodisca vitripennis]|nr:hypothetical protein J6590_002385 [Homalodisca vitripennis]
MTTEPEQECYLQGQDRSVVTQPSSSYARHCLTRLSWTIGSQDIGFIETSIVYHMLRDVPVSSMGPSMTSPLSSHIDNDRIFKCDVCKVKAYKRKSHLIRHLRYECFQEPTFKCVTCGKKFKQKSNLTQHMSGCRGLTR